MASLEVLLILFRPLYCVNLSGLAVAIGVALLLVASASAALKSAEAQPMAATQNRLASLSAPRIDRVAQEDTHADESLHPHHHGNTAATAQDAVDGIRYAQELTSVEFTASDRLCSAWRAVLAESRSQTSHHHLSWRA